MDLIENGSADGGPDVDEPDDDDLTWGHPTTLALTSFALSVLVLFGASLLRGGYYTATFAIQNLNSYDNGRSTRHNWGIAAAIISLAFAVVPLAIAQVGLRRLVPSDGPWTAHLLRAAFVLSVIVVVLRCVLVLISLHDSGQAGLTIQN